MYNKFINNKVIKNIIINNKGEKIKQIILKYDFYY